MINHIVLFKLKDYPEQEKREILTEHVSALMALKDKIKELKYIEVGINHELNSTNYDLALISHFENLDDLETYRVHPEHQKVSKRIVETTVPNSRVAVDFEF